MLNRWTATVAAMALSAGSCPVPALAQPVFFDDFDGPDFLPHWRVPPPENWEYNFSGGRLNVTDLHFPGIAHLEGNFATMRTTFDSQTDFRLDVWMGWEREPSPQYDELVVTVMSPTGGHMAWFGLMYPGGPPVIGAASTGAGSVRASPPSPGTHQFTIARTGAIFDFYLNGDHFGSLPDLGAIDPAAGMQVFFGKAFPGDMNPKHIDRVLVVPAPGAVALAATCALMWTRRRPR